MSRPRKPLTPEQAKDAADRYRRGQSLYFIAIALTRDVAAVRAALVEQGVKIRRSGRHSSGSWGFSGGYLP